MLRNNTTPLMILASVGVCVALFGSSTFSTQYFRLAGGHSPTRAGLMTIPLIVCQMLSSTLIAALAVVTLLAVLFVHLRCRCATRSS